MKRRQTGYRWLRPRSTGGAVVYVRRDTGAIRLQDGALDFAFPMRSRLTSGGATRSRASDRLIGAHQAHEVVEHLVVVAAVGVAGAVVAGVAVVAGFGVRPVKRNMRLVRREGEVRARKAEQHANKINAFKNVMNLVLQFISVNHVNTKK